MCIFSRRIRSSAKSGAGTAYYLYAECSSHVTTYSKVCCVVAQTFVVNVVFDIGVYKKNLSRQYKKSISSDIHVLFVLFVCFIPSISPSNYSFVVRQFELNVRSISMFIPECFSVICGFRRPFLLLPRSKACLSEVRLT